MFSKPATGNFSASLRTVILCGMPIHADEHLVHGWDALQAALDESSKDDGGDRTKVAANIRYARMRLEHTLDGIKRVKRLQKRDAVKAEAVELAKAIDDAVRFF